MNHDLAFQNLLSYGMKRFFKVLGVLILLLALFAFYIVYSSGFFRSIDPYFDGEILTKISIPGAEDMQADHEAGFIIISSDDRASRRDGRSRQGHLYKMRLDSLSEAPIRLTTDFKKPFYPHGISMIRTSDSTHRVFAINHVKGDHFIEVFDLHGDALMHMETLSDPSMISPNDIVALGPNEFYFTNDHKHTEGTMRLAEDYLGLRLSNVVYFDGNGYQEVDKGIAYANGINFDTERNLLFVASPRDFLVKVYQRKPGGSLDFIENVDCGTGVDNIEFDGDGRLWIGSHPSLLHFSSYAAGKRAKSPSEIVVIDYRGESDYEVSSVYLEDGSEMSAATVAVPVDDRHIFLGNVMDEHFLILKRD